MRSHDATVRDNDAYFAVLCDLAGLKGPVEQCCYFEVMRQLYSTKFYWTVPNDDNRGLDGLRLRERYGYTTARNHPCSLLEMLIALSERCEDDIMYDPKEGDRSVDWFWMMMRNLGLNKFRDSSFEDAWNTNHVTFITDRLMDRDYSENGVGGLFPLKHPNKDQRDVEIWYQLSAYLMENYDI